MVHNGAVKLRTAAPVMILLLVAGCGGSSHATKKADNPAVATTAPHSTTAAKPGTKPGAKPGQTTAPGGSHATASTAPGGSHSTSAPAGKPTAPGSTAPGSYTYDTKGKATVDAFPPSDAAGTQTLKVDKPSGANQHSSLGGDQGGGTEQDVTHRTDGTYLVRLVINSPMGRKEFHPTSPVLGIAKPEQVGRSWSWSMTSTDGKTKADYSAKYVKQEDVTIGGTVVHAWVIESTLKISGDLDVTEHSTTDYDSTRLLDIRHHATQSGKITYQGTPHTFSSDTTSTLRSVRPS